MFKMGLLTSTAMTAVALLLSGAPAQAQTDMHIASHDPNTRFLCTYGQFLVSAYSSQSSGFLHSSWTHVAVPVAGHGQTVGRINVIEAQDRYIHASSFTAGIYGNSPSGFPGKPIAVGTGRLSASCGPVKISITPTKLRRSRTYWIEETIVHNQFPSEPSIIYWEADPNTNRKAYVQYHWWGYSSGCSCSDSYTSPWTKQTTGPYFKLR